MILRNYDINFMGRGITKEERALLLLAIQWTGGVVKGWCMHLLVHSVIESCCLSASCMQCYARNWGLEVNKTDTAPAFLAFTGCLQCYLFTAWAGCKMENGRLETLSIFEGDGDTLIQVHQLNHTSSHLYWISNLSDICLCGWHEAGGT